MAGNLTTAAASRVGKYTSLGRSYFVSLTLPDFRGAEDSIRRSCNGANLVEFRVDLLSSQDEAFVTEQFQVLRGSTNLDIIYTVRTKAQGGAWPDEDATGLFDLYQLGLRLGAEILDVEMQLNANLVESTYAKKGTTLILASHHDWTGTLSWDDASWQQWYDKAHQHGDIVKLVGTATRIEDNIALENFRIRVGANSKKPLIAINMGVIGQMSRILNPFMTPVTHSALTDKAAPGQLSVVEIRQALQLMGLEEGHSMNDGAS